MGGQKGAADKAWLINMLTAWSYTLCVPAIAAISGDQNEIFSGFRPMRLW